MTIIDKISVLSLCALLLLLRVPSCLAVQEHHQVSGGAVCVGEAQVCALFTSTISNGSASSTQQQKYTLLVAPPERGHLNPMLALGVQLAQQHPSRPVVLALADDSIDDPSNTVAAARAAGLTVLYVGASPVNHTAREERIVALTRSGSVLDALKFVAEWQRALNALYYPRIRDAVQAAAPKAVPAIVVTDVLLLVGTDVAAEAGAPCVMLCPTVLDVLGFGGHSPLTLPYLASTEPAAAAAASLPSRLRTLGWRLVSQAVRAWIRLPRLSQDRAQLGLPPISHGSLQRHLEERGVMVIAPLVPGIEPPRPLHPAVALVGPMLLQPAQGATAAAPGHVSPDLAHWLGQGSFVYVSLGSLAVADRAQLVGILEGVLGVVDGVAARRCVWARGHDLFQREDALQQPFVQSALQSNALRLEAGYVPQLALLRHPNIQAFVTHAGCGSAHEGLATGVPMLTVPLFGDQFYIAKRLQELGVGRGVDATAPDLAAAVQEGLRALLEPGSEVEEAVALQQAVVAASGGVERAAQLVAGMEATHGAHYLMPYDASWSVWMRYSADTVLLLALLVAACVCGCVKTLRHCCCRNSSSRGVVTHDHAE